ncbi:hypothetical protein evm_011157 [Chilo suppressalis]|nr:hypothetical protein evm_011157 [Chilo suppressalis]
MAQAVEAVRKEEAILEKWILEMAEKHIPVTRDELLDSVQRFIIDQNKTTPFTTNRPGKQAKTYSIGDYVIIQYEGDFFPGVIKNFDINKFEITTMAFLVGNTFKWSEKEDKIWYQKSDIVKAAIAPGTTRVCTTFRDFFGKTVTFNCYNLAMFLLRGVLNHTNKVLLSSASLSTGSGPSGSNNPEVFFVSSVRSGSTTVIKYTRLENNPSRIDEPAIRFVSLTNTRKHDKRVRPAQLHRLGTVFGALAAQKKEKNIDKTNYDAGFVKPESTNLPRIDALMVGEFVALNPDFCSEEQRNDKASM